MPTTITNQATLQYTYGTTTATAASNIATTVMQEAFSVYKSTLENTYRADGELTYLVTLVNSGRNALTNVTITDNLGTYAVSPAVSVTPLYYNDPAHLYINGVFSAALTPAPGINSITFTIPSIPAGANAMLLYKADVNDAALPETGSDITNTVFIRAAGMAEPVTATHTIAVEEYADVRIVKAMSPNPVASGSALTYAFTIYNYGNTAATNVVLNDQFSPAPEAITVRVNGTPIDASDYTYAAGTLTLPGSDASIALTIPAATFYQDAATGAVATDPGTASIEVTGTI